MELVTDAVRSLNDAASASMMEAFLAAGGALTTVSVATGPGPKTYARAGRRPPTLQFFMRFFQAFAHS